MARFISADYVFPGNGPAIKKGVIAVSGDEITAVFQSRDPYLQDKEIERFQGIIVPGFINTHCHLELSYLKGRAPRGTGLIGFIKEMIGARSGYDPDTARDAMSLADRQMYENGIVAVGDISNHAGSRTVKEESNLYYHTFVEVMSFDPARAADAYRLGTTVCAEFSPLPVSIVPHAPYSVSKELFRIISKFSSPGKALLSLHNQESDEENKLFRYKTGAFIDFYRDMGIDISFFKPNARDSIQSVASCLPADVPVLLVHNTYMNMRDIFFLKRTGHQINFCFCPAANLYIEKKLPPVDIFTRNGFDITLGTDSLASNDKLCILSEMKIIQEHFPEISTHELISWATINGARFLNIDGRFGSIEPGKRPGLNLISHIRNDRFTRSSAVTRIL